ncbi:flavin reductase family protein [Kibdelosporangium philippinense]|uniref:Flavin reductase family protein n=1 Tax=Kibdelosporangium philippinense TaxID=211113 RepID=A0ABS8Z2S7_9PSEU|nr:flavin reductase family protein [Kibdelosporangium philippinense]MCE7002254.1 flavin reductase family protein [Kibdelosporangium philippinense]
MPTELQNQFREAMAQVATPVSVVTTVADGQPYGSTVSAFASLSMEPPMVLVSLFRTSGLLPAIRSSGRFGLNILGSAHSRLATGFATRRRPSEKFAGVPWMMDEGLPRLTGAPGWVACDVWQEVDGGDHTVLFGLVRGADTSGGEPLTYHLRSYGTHRMLPRTDASLTLMWALEA